MKRTALLLMGLLIGGMSMSAESAKLQTATFAGGCFWCMEPPYKDIPGVHSVTVGYTGGRTKNPTYEQVCTGATGHSEAVQVVFDPSQVPYEKLLAVYWHNIDPTQSDGQFADEGSQYEPVIFYHNEEQKRLAEASKEALAKSGKFDRPIAVQIRAASVFYPAEEYHQDYAVKCPLRYKQGSGRQSFIEKVWGKSH